MAIMFENVTKCGICNSVINDIITTTMFPPFISNVKDELHFFSDNSFHTECLKNHYLSGKAVIYVNNYLNSSRPENRICLVSHEKIIVPENYIYFGVLSSNESNEISNYNFITLDKNNLEKWKERFKFIEVAKKFKDSDNWETVSRIDPLSILIRVMEDGNG